MYTQQSPVKAHLSDSIAITVYQSRLVSLGSPGTKPPPHRGTHYSNGGSELVAVSEENAPGPLPWWAGLKFLPNGKYPRNHHAGLDRDPRVTRV